MQSSLEIYAFRLTPKYKMWVSQMCGLLGFTRVNKTFDNSKDFPKERYNTYAKSCNSNLYTKYPGATYSGLLLGTMCCL